MAETSALAQRIFHCGEAQCGEAQEKQVSERSLADSKGCAWQQRQTAERAALSAKGPFKWKPKGSRLEREEKPRGWCG